MSGQVDFYILPSTGERERMSFACRLAEKAVSRGHRVFVTAASETSGRELDELLWTFREDSFLPHTLVTDSTGHADRPLEPVLIGLPGAEPSDPDVLINLAPGFPGCADRWRCCRCSDKDSERGRIARRRRRST